MKKLLLLLVAGLTLMSCENLEDELNDANAEIAQLEAQVNELSADLQDAIALNNSQAQQLAELESMIISLNSDLETAYGANIFLGNEIGELTAQLSALNEEIAILQADLATALDNSADEATIQSLVDQIAALEAIEPEVVIEYITVIETVIETVTVTETVTEYVPTEYDAETATIEDLRDELSRLQDIVDEAVASQTTIVTEVETSEERLESYWILDANGDGDMLDTYVRIETQDVTYNYDGEAIFWGELTVTNSVTVDVAPAPADGWSLDESSTESSKYYNHEGGYRIIHYPGISYGRLRAEGDNISPAYQPVTLDELKSKAADFITLYESAVSIDVNTFTYQLGGTPLNLWSFDGGVYVAQFGAENFRYFTDDGDGHIQSGAGDNEFGHDRDSVHQAIGNYLFDF